MDRPYSVASIANEFLKLASEEGQSLSPMKLIKLVYVAHGWSLGLRGRRLVDRAPEAWPYGPVFSDLYKSTKRYGRGAVTAPIGDDEIPLDDTSTRSFVKSVWNAYKKMDAFTLSDITHMPGTPWYEVFKVMFEGNPPSGEPIGDDLIKEHYEKLLKERQGGEGGGKG